MQSFLDEKKVGWETEKKSAIETCSRRVAEITEELKKYTEKYHENQRKKLLWEKEVLLQKLQKIGSNVMWSTLEQESQKYVQIFEHEQMLENIEKRIGGGTGSSSTSASTCPESASICMARLQGKAPEIHIKSIPVCSTPACREQVMTYDSNHSTLHCQRCGRTTTFLDATSNLTAYGDEVEITNFSYKRVTHFQTQLLFAQGKESTRVPEDVIQTICQCLREKFGFSNTDTITLEDVSKAMKVLKNMKLRKYYKCKVQILGRITGKPPLRMTSDQELRFQHYFQQLQPAVDKLNTDDIVLPYRFCMHRIAQMMDLPEFERMFPLPKSAKKLKVFDLKFKKAALELGWDVSKFHLTC